MISKEEGISPEFRDQYRWDEIWYSYYVSGMIYYDSFAKDTFVHDVLDVGCGYGTLAMFAEERYKCDVYTLDLEKRLPKKYRKPLNFTQIDIEYDEIPYEDIMFDRIIMTEVIEHFKHCPIPTLKKITNRLMDDGYLYLSTPNGCSWGHLGDFYNHIGEMTYPNSDNRTHKNGNEHTYQYTEGELRFILHQAGLEVVEWKEIHPPTWPSHFNIKLQKKR